MEIFLVIAFLLVFVILPIPISVYIEEKRINKTSNILFNAAISERKVIRGLWGNGEQRYINLTNAGYDYNAIQAIVNSK